MINKEQNTYREIKGFKDVKKEVYFYDYTKKEYYLIGVLQGFDFNMFIIKLLNGDIRNFQTGFIKEVIKE